MKTFMAALASGTQTLEWTRLHGFLPPDDQLRGFLRAALEPLPANRPTAAQCLTHGFFGDALRAAYDSHVLPVATGTPAPPGVVVRKTCELGPGLNTHQHN